VALPSVFGVQELGFFPGDYLNSRNTITLIIIAVVICSSDSPGQAQQTALQRPLDTTVCEIVRNPQKFDGRVVRFQAKFQSDGRHGSVLTELECVRGIIPFLPDGIEHHPDIEALDYALDQGLRGTTTDKRIVSSFVGRFIVHRGRSSRSVFMLEISKIENLQVKVVDLKPHLPR
jgi:hypothetical protein